MTALSGEKASTSAKQNQPKAPSNLTQRVLTMLIGGPLALVMVYLGGWAFAAFVTAMAVLGAAEFYLLAKGRALHGSTLVGVPAVILVAVAYFAGQSGWALVVLIIALLLAFVIKWRANQYPQLAAGQALMTAAGILYIGFPTGFLIAMRGLPDGLVWILLVLALTWGTDSFAYIGGRLFGRHQLAPVISPKKTVEGAIVGYFGGFIPSLIVLAVAAKISPALLVLIALGPLVAILGDLLESWMKRRFDVKDSHLHGLNIFPGHGGVLDRVDALIFVTIFCYFALALFGLT